MVFKVEGPSNHISLSTFNFRNFLMSKIFINVHNYYLLSGGEIKNQSMLVKLQCLALK